MELGEGEEMESTQTPPPSIIRAHASLAHLDGNFALRRGLCSGRSLRRGRAGGEGVDAHAHTSAVSPAVLSRHSRVHLPERL